MKHSDALRKQAELEDMVEGTDVNWYECVRSAQSGIVAIAPPSFNLSTDQYEFALFILDGKPVFKGDMLYLATGDGFRMGIDPYPDNAAGGCPLFWSPPEPPKKMVNINGVDVPFPVAPNLDTTAMTLHFECYADMSDFVRALIRK